MIDKEYVIPVSHCPICKHKFNRASAVKDEKKPEEGDVTLCIECGALLQFDANLKIVPMLERELTDELKLLVHKTRMKIRIVKRRRDMH